jgi:hypothetical protein
VPGPRLPRGSQLNAVAAPSARNAWAVGDTLSSAGMRTLTAHRNGTAWK